MMMNTTKPSIRASFFPTLCVGLALSLGACGDGATKGDADVAAESDTTIQQPDAIDSDAAVSDDALGCALGAACDDGDPCTEGDQCDAAGVCAGAAKSCDDQLSCTTDACSEGTCTHALNTNFCLAAEGTVCVAVGAADPQNGCSVCSAGQAGASFGKRVDGFSCTDGNACSTADRCADGLCVGGDTLVCTSNDPCVSKTCDPASGCVSEFTTANCDDGDPCTVGDVCNGGTCRAGGESLVCDDGDLCTTGACLAGVGCQFTFACDDGERCTNDSCDATSGACTHEAFVGACDDGNPCTENEVCDAAGVCAQGTAVSCFDDNSCTVDICDPTRGGCLGLFVTAECDEMSCVPAACDDGDTCTRDDQCVAGACFGGKTRDCGLCEVTPTDAANKIVRLEISSDGNAGSGLDLDNDPNTCAPSGECGGGVDNALAPLASVLGNNIQASVDDGVVMWLVDLKAWDGTTAPFTMSVYDSGLADSNLSCDYQGGPNAPAEVTEICDYDVAQLSFDQNCEPYFSFDNAVIELDKINAGSPETLIRMVLPLASGSLLGLTIAAARFEGTVAYGLNGQVQSVNGILGGAIPKVQLIQAVLELRPEDIGGLDPTAVVPLIDLLVENDIDLDGDGLNDAASVAIRITTIPARIVE